MGTIRLDDITANIHTHRRQHDTQAYTSAMSRSSNTTTHARTGIERSIDNEHRLYEHDSSRTTRTFDYTTTTTTNHNDHTTTTA